MIYKKINGWKDKAGTEYWGGDRIDRMVKTRHLPENDMLPLLYKVPGLGTGLNVLDVGSGIGRRHVYFKDDNYKGIDRETIMVENAAKYFPELSIRQCDAMFIVESFPEFQSYFDLCLTYHVIQYNHLEQQTEILKQINSVLKSGGYYYMKENTIYEHNNIGYACLKDTHSLNNSSYTLEGWKNKVCSLGFSFICADDKHGHMLYRKD